MKHIYLLVLMLVGILMPGVVKAATPDSVFVVKQGRIFSKYEVGKDVDNIQLAKKQVAQGNMVTVGGETVEMKSALVDVQSDMFVIYFSTSEGCQTLSDVANSKAYMQVAISTDAFGEEFAFNKFATKYPDGYFNVTFVDTEKYDNDDDYEPVAFANDDWNDYFEGGTFSVTQEEDHLVLKITTEPKSGVDEFSVNYDDVFGMLVKNSSSFIVDDYETQVRAAFAEKLADGIAFYLTPGNIDKANDLEDCYYYTRIFVPTSAMNGEDIDVTGNSEYELTLVDNMEDPNHSKTFTAATGMANNATGFLSVLDNGDGSYSIDIDVDGLGRTDTRSLHVSYEGVPADYDLSVPSQYTVAGGDAVDFKSAVVVHDFDKELYTAYLSSKENVTTVEGMADADFVITVPEDFVNDDMLHGFSGPDLNGQISVKYDGVTYCQANTGHADNAIAQGGNVKATVNGDKANIDFTVFGTTKYNGSIVGHFEGTVTRVTIDNLK